MTSSESNLLIPISFIRILVHEMETVFTTQIKILLAKINITQQIREEIKKDCIFTLF